MVSLMRLEYSRVGWDKWTVLGGRGGEGEVELDMSQSSILFSHSDIMSGSCYELTCLGIKWCSHLRLRIL